MERSINRTFLGYEELYDPSKTDSFEQTVIVCHSLSDFSGELVGSPLEKEMFKVTNWIMTQDDPSVTVLGHSLPVIAKMTRPSPVDHQTSQTTSFASTNIQSYLSPTASNPMANRPDDLFVLRRFQFDAHLQRSAVVFTSCDSDKLRFAVKGSPESIRNICRPNTLPSNFHEVYSNYAAKGRYVLAFASRTIEIGQKPSVSGRSSKSHHHKKDKSHHVQLVIEDFSIDSIASLSREQLERDLTFEGFVLLENPLKAESQSTITLLKEANIRNVIM